jgi:hypothetical protein
LKYSHKALPPVNTTIQTPNIEPSTQRQSPDDHNRKAGIAKSQAATQKNVSTPMIGLELPTSERLGSMMFSGSDALFLLRGEL